MSHLSGKKIISAFAVTCGLWGAPARAADPVLNSGTGLLTCAELVKIVDPKQGLENTGNASLYEWSMGYMSAANIHNLVTDGEIINLAPFKSLIVKGVYDSCQKTPGEKVITIIDATLKSAVKLPEAQFKGKPVPWAK
jgi:hypothetical protein